MEQRLIVLKKKGMSSSEICEQLSFEFDATFTRNSVISKAYRMGVEKMVLPKEPKLRKNAKSSFWTLERERRLRHFISEGMTYTDIGYKMGKDRNTISAKCRQLGISTPYTKDDAKRINKVNRIERKQEAWEKNARDRSEWRRKVHDAMQRKQEGIIYPPVVTYSNDKYGQLLNPNARRLSLMELAPNQCHFTTGDPKKSNFAYCGADVPEGSAKPYCEYCIKLMYVPSKYSSDKKAYRT